MKNTVKISVEKIGSMLKIAEVTKNKEQSSTSVLLLLDNAVEVIDGAVKLHPLVIEILENRYFINVADVIGALESGNNIIDVSPTNKFLKHSKIWEYRSWLFNSRNQIHTEIKTPYSADIQVAGIKGFNVAYGATKEELEKNIKENIALEINARVHERNTSSLVDFITDEINSNVWVIHHLVMSNTYVLVENSTLDIYGNGNPKSFSTKEKAEEEVTYMSLVDYTCQLVY